MSERARGAASEGPAQLLVTGCYRSGTTLVEKLLDMHPRVQVASQPFPLLYTLVKARFLERRGLERRYPLDHLFRETGYRRSELARFLDEERLDQAFIDELFDRLEDYTQGLWTPEILACRGAIRPGRFLELRARLHEQIGRIFPREGLAFRGSKEVLVEEYAPYLLERGTQVVQVLRDPRAMIASLNFRERDNKTGEHRPVLYSVRAWRKSVALSTLVERSERGCRVLYEELVQDQAATLLGLTSALGLEPFAEDAFAGGIRDQRGGDWRGNSSFSDRDGVSTASLRTFEKKLPRSVLAFVEATCEPEMRLLGQALSTEKAERDEALTRYADPFETVHASFPADYSSDPRRLADERRRLELLRGEATALSETEIEAWFLDAEAWRRLRGAA